MNLIDLVKLLKLQKWYKNLMIFLPLVFAGLLFESAYWPTLILGFIVLSLVSSVSYIINDIVDAKADRSHPQKKNRPIASGRVKPMEGLMLAAVLVIIAVGISAAYIQNTTFELLVLALFISMQLYTLYFKNIMLIDINFIAINFIIRTISGTVLIGIGVSPWLFILIYLLALFWAVAKRKVEISTLHNAGDHRKVHNQYSETMLNYLCNVLAGTLIAAYYVFASTTHNSGLLITVPFAVFMIFKFLYYVYNNREEAQSPELMTRDPQMMVALGVWFLLAVYVLY